MAQFYITPPALLADIMPVWDVATEDIISSHFHLPVLVNAKVKWKQENKYSFFVNVQTGHLTPGQTTQWSSHCHFSDPPAPP